MAMRVYVLVCLVCCAAIGCSTGVVVGPYGDIDEQVGSIDASSDADVGTGEDAFQANHDVSLVDSTDEDEIAGTWNNDASPVIEPDEEFVSDSNVFTVAVLSDFNGSYGTTTYRRDVHAAVEWVVKELKPDLVLATGDMVAGQKAGLDYRAMWEGFHDAVTIPLAMADIPFAPTPGNHDASGYAAFQHEREIYVDEWLAYRPDVTFVDDTHYPLKYAFEFGPALFVSLDATTVGKLSSDQKQWLRNVFESRDDLPVRVVYGHVPLYGVAQGRESEMLNDPDLEQLLNEYNVEMFIGGHHHAYYPGRRGDLRLVQTACLGAGPRRLVGDDAISERSVIVFEYAYDGVLSLDAYKSTSFSEIVRRESLPEAVNVNTAQVIYRDDVEQ